MNVLFFLIFLISSMVYLWNGNDDFDKRGWLKIGLYFIFILVATMAAAFILRGLIFLGLDMSVHHAKALASAFSLSFMAIIMLKFVVVMLNFIFSRIIGFHRKYNADNFDRLSFFTERFPKGFLTPFKVLLSIGSVLVYYGIWFVIAAS